jgi:hypothetical protein
MKANVHRRLFSVPPEVLRPWIEAAWSGTTRDCFPRDVIRSWRKNPPGVDPLALIPGVTRLGHAWFTFHLRQWDGERWRVEFGTSSLRGWHRFDLLPQNGGSLLTHIIWLEARPLGIVGWRLLVEPIHDWAVEALFDRLETAVATGSVPERTARPMGRRARWGLWLLRRIAGRPRSRARRRAALA